MEGKFDHVGLSLADLDAGEEFYANAFGLVREFAFDLHPLPVRGIMLKHPSGWRLELFERAGATGGIRAANPLGALGTLGYGHFAVAAVDIEPLYAAAQRAGAREVQAPGPSPEPGVRFAFLADPEGNLIELVERPEPAR